MPSFLQVQSKEDNHIRPLQEGRLLAAHDAQERWVQRSKVDTFFSKRLEVGCIQRQPRDKCMWEGALGLGGCPALGVGTKRSRIRRRPARNEVQPCFCHRAFMRFARGQNGSASGLLSWKESRYDIGCLHGDMTQDARNRCSAF